MFERRLKIFLGVLVLLSAVLLARAIVIQVGRHDYWTKRAAGLLETSDTTETTRGNIVDCHGVILAEDQACTDAAVDYRAIISPPDPDWVDDISLDRLKARLGPDVWKHTPRAKRRELVVAEGANTRADIDRMWDTLALLSEPTDDPAAPDPHTVIADLRASIIQKVEMQRRWLWFTNFQQNQSNAADAPRWQRWLAGGSGADGPDIDRFVVEVGDQKRPHVILAAISETKANVLGKRLEQFPGLVLQPSIRRHYPLQTTACHVLGRMSRVDKADVLNSQKSGVGPAREYLPNDTIGREGIEAMCEPLLRGSRGQIERRAGSDDVVEQTPFKPGQNVTLTIDSALQADVQELFKSVPVKFLNEDMSTASLDLHDMHGAAVVIDVPTGEVRALVSNPDFNLDQIDDQYRTLAAQTLSNPLRNRATLDQLEPGSTVKPMMGTAAITQKSLKPLEGIECTGDLYLPARDENGAATDKKTRQIGGRCWVASEWGKKLRALDPPREPVHHIIPEWDPHKGHDGNHDGFLTFSDALERSCNIFFETTADRLGEEGVSYWYDQFGFGRPTGIGILESAGRIPRQFHSPPAVTRRIYNCFAGIGQHNIWATPLQIANEAATLARGGIWMRPRLLSVDEQAKLDKVRPRVSDAVPDRVDLHLDPEGLEQAKLGMQKVVYELAGTGRQLIFPEGGRSEERDPVLQNIRVAGKTGTAEAARLWQNDTDANGKPVIDPATGKPKRRPLVPSTVNAVSTETPWYWSSNDKGTTFVHAWFMGYAPVENPQIAFAVLVEYSPTGGGSASGSIARRLLERCVAHDYLHPAPMTTPVTTASR